MSLMQPIPLMSLHWKLDAKKHADVANSDYSNLSWLNSISSNHVYLPKINHVFKFPLSTPHIIKVCLNVLTHKFNLPNRRTLWMAASIVFHRHEAVEFIRPSCCIRKAFLIITGHLLLGKSSTTFNKSAILF